MRDVNHRKGSGEGQVIELGAAPGFPIVAQIAVHQGPISDIVASPDGSRLMVTNYGRDSVSVIDTDSCHVVQDVPGLNEPFALAVGSHDADRVYVSTVSPAYDSIAVIDVPDQHGRRDASAGAQCERPRGEPRRKSTSTPAETAPAVPTSPSWTRRPAAWR